MSKKNKNLNVDAGGNPIEFKDNKIKKIEAKTHGQKVYMDTIREKCITLAQGVAGTGKTLLSISISVEMLRENKIDKIILTRPIIEACGDEIGLLPGTAEEKIRPYLLPLLYELENCATKTEINTWLKNGTLEIVPVGHMRGRNFHRSFVIVDEAENLTFEQFKLIITRLGKETKAVFSGDLSQSDLTKYKIGAMSNFIEILEGLPYVGIVKLTKADIVRSKYLSEIIDRIEAWEEKNK